MIHTDAAHHSSDCFYFSSHLILPTTQRVKHHECALFSGKETEAQVMKFSAQFHTQELGGESGT